MKLLYIPAPLARLYVIMIIGFVIFFNSTKGYNKIFFYEIISV